MPSLFQSNTATGAATRSRRARGDSESRRQNGQRMDSGVSRRVKEFSTKNPDRRSPPSKSTSPSTSIYTQPNITHDAASTSPSSGETSPISPRSPDLRPDMRASQTHSGPAGFFQLSSEPQTPAALLQYLDTEDESLPPEPLTKSKTEGAFRPAANNPPPLRSQPAIIQQYREKEIANTPPAPVRREQNEATLRPRAFTSRPRPQSAFIQSFEVKAEDLDDTPLSEPETSSKKTGTTINKYRRPMVVPGTYGDSSTDGTDSTDGTEGTTDDDESQDGEDYYHHQAATPRPVNQGPSLPPKLPVSATLSAPVVHAPAPAYAPAAVSSLTTSGLPPAPAVVPIFESNPPVVVAAPVPSAAAPPRLERTQTVIQHQDSVKQEEITRHRRQDSGQATARSPSAFVKPTPVPNVLQFLQTEDEATTPTQEKRQEAATASTKVPPAATKPHQSIASQYFATQRRISPNAPLKRENSDPGTKAAAPSVQPVTPATTASAAATTNPPVNPVAATTQISKQPAALPVGEKDDKASIPQPIQREPSHKTPRYPEVSRPSMTSATSAYMEKVPVATPIQREPSNKGARNQDTSRPPMPSASAAYFERTNRQSSQPPSTRREPAEPPIKSPTLPSRPLGHVFPAQHYQDNTFPNAQQSRKGSHEAQVTSPVLQYTSPQMSVVSVSSITGPQSAMPSRPLTPESNFKDEHGMGPSEVPPHMSMSMPQLPGANYRQEHLPQYSRAYTPPTTLPPRDMDPSSVVHPMPMYPYAMQDPRAYYSNQYQNMQQGNPYLVEPQYNFPPAPMQPGPFYNNSPDPYRNHRMSLASTSAESRQTPEASEVPRSLSQTRAATGRTSPQDESAELLSRIQHALPDLQLLLSRCEEVTGHHKEGPKQTATVADHGDAQQQALKQKTVRIEELEKELHSKAQAHATERNKMRFEIGNLQEQYRDLQDELVGIQRRRKSSDQTSAQLDVFRADVENLRHELESSLVRQRELLEAKAASDKMVVSMEAQLRALNAEMEAKKINESSLQSRLDEVLSAHTRERQAMAAQGKTEQRQLEDRQFKDRQELESALKAKDGKYEEARRAWTKEKEELQKIWQKEKEDLQKAWLREREELGGSYAKEKEELVKSHAKDKDDVHKSHSREKEELLRNHEDNVARIKADADKDARSATRRHEKALVELERNLEAKFDDHYKELESDNSKLRRDYKRVKRDWHLDKERGREEREKLRTAAGKMQAEHTSLMKILEVFSEPTERDKEREEKRERREKEQQSKKDDGSQQG